MSEFDRTPGTSPEQWGFLKRFLVGRSWRRTLLRIGLLILLVMATYRWVLLPLQVTGDSMLPTFLDGEVRIAYRLAYRTVGPQRGDIVVINIAGGREFLVKRIIALPGERFAMRAGVTFIDGAPLEEPYIRTRNPTWTRPEIILRPDEYFFVGDNRSMDMMNHTADTVRIERIMGKVVY